MELPEYLKGKDPKVDPEVSETTEIIDDSKDSE